MINGAIARIILRYGVGALAGWGVGKELAVDPDIQALATIGVSVAMGTVIEGWYWLAKRMGWKT